MNELKRTLEGFALDTIEDHVWSTFCDAESKFTLDLGLEISHVEPAMLKKLTKSLAKCDEECWEQLRVRNGQLSSLDALLCVFGQLSSLNHDDPRTSLACVAYITLLSIPKADSQWSSVFRPVLMRRIIKLLATTIKVVKKTAKVDAAEDGAEEEKAVDVKAWVAVLERLCAMLAKYRMAPTLDGILSAMEELVLIGASPIESHRQEVSDHVYDCLFHMVDKGTDRVYLCSILYKLLMPALMMTQRGHIHTIPKSMYMVKDSAVAFVNRCSREFPELLERTERENPKEDEIVLDAAAAEKEARGKKEGKNMEAKGENENEENEENEVAEPADTQERVITVLKPAAPLILDPAVALCEHICLYCPERTDWREAAGASIACMLKDHVACMVRFVDFLSILLACDVSNRRVISAEVTVSVLSSGSVASPWPLLESIVSRTCDQAPTVRSKALIGMALAVSRLSAEDQEKVFSPQSTQHINFRSIFMLRAQDEKPNVRKAALTFLDSIVPIGMKYGLEISPAIEMIASLTGDSSVTVRKSALHTMSQILALSPRVDIYTAWANAVLTTIVDSETSVAEKALEEVEANVFTPLAHDFAAMPKNEKSLNCPVFHLMRVFDENATEYLQRALALMRKKAGGQFPKHLRRCFDEVVRYCMACERPREWPIALWSLLEEATAYEPDIIDSNLIVDSYDFLREADNGAVDAVLTSKTLNIVSQVTSQIDEARKAHLMSHLLSDLLEFNAPCFLIKNMMTTLAGVASGNTQFINKLLKSIHTNVLAYVAPSEARDVPSTMLQRYIFTLGEIALVDEKRVSATMVEALRSLATGHVYNDSGQLRGASPAVRGHAFMALGKLCLRREDLAKRSVELIVLHLQEQESYIVRNNVLIVLCDLAMKYTSLVDRFVPLMANMLRDKHVLLRKQAAMIISSLLAEEFIKFKGSCMMRILYGLSDTSAEIRHFIESVFSRILVPRNPSIFAHNFIDFICSLNNWTALPNFQGAIGNEDFSLQKFPSRRAMIYRFMLSKMSNEQKFGLAGHIVKDILGAFVDPDEGGIPLPTRLDDGGTSVLTDCLALLGCKEMKVCFNKDVKTTEDENPEEATQGGGEQVRAQMLSQVMKRNMCENVVPSLLELRTAMEKQTSPYLKQMNICLREVLMEYRSDLSVILGGDAQMIKEIEFDMSEQKEKKQRRCSLLRMLVPTEGEISNTAEAQRTGRPSIASLSRFARTATAGVAQTPPLLNSILLRGKNVRHSTPARMTREPDPASPIIPRKLMGTPRRASGSSHMLTPSCTHNEKRARQSLPGRMPAVALDRSSLPDSLGTGTRQTASLPNRTESLPTRNSSLPTEEFVVDIVDGAEASRSAPASKKRRARDSSPEQSDGGREELLRRVSSPESGPDFRRFASPDKQDVRLSATPESELSPTQVIGRSPDLARESRGRSTRGLTSPSPKRARRGKSPEESRASWPGIASRTSLPMAERVASPPPKRAKVAATKKKATKRKARDSQLE